MLVVLATISTTFLLVIYSLGLAIVVLGAMALVPVLFALMVLAALP